MPKAFAIQVRDSAAPLAFYDKVLSDEEQSSCAANEPASPLCVVAYDRVGAAYFGNLVADILEYRELRNQRLRGEELTEAQTDTLERLDARLRQPPGDGDVESRLRSFYRFECGFPAQVRSTLGYLEVDVEDISAGGLKLRAEHSVTPGDPVFMMLPTTDPECSITFPSRVAWVKDDVFGVMFAGPARRAPGRSAR